MLLEVTDAKIETYFSRPVLGNKSLGQIMEMWTKLYKNIHSSYTRWLRVHS